MSTTRPLRAPDSLRGPDPVLPATHPVLHSSVPPHHMAEIPGLLNAEVEAEAAVIRLLEAMRDGQRMPETIRKAADDAYLAVGYLAAVLRHPKK